LMAQAAKGEQERELELGLPWADQRVVRVYASRVGNGKSGPAGTMFVFHDVTRLRQLETTRQEFVANVSHELRTPLSLIQGFVETLLNGAKDDPKGCTRFLQTIAKHTDRLTFLIEDLLTISALESGRVVMNFQNLNLRELTARVCGDLMKKAPQKGVSLSNEVPEDLECHADGDRLQQVLFNLIETAIKYGREEGTVQIGARDTGEGMIEVQVKDDGPGIPPAAQERVFERFFRADKARSRETGGTGLGLAIVKHIAHAHHGEVRLESKPGEGATFYFTIPVAKGLAGSE